MGRVKGEAPLKLYHMNFKQQRFITEFLRYGDKIIAYKTAYDNPSSDPEVIISAANRLLRQPEIREAIEAAQNRIRYQVEAELKEELKQELLTIQRKREILAQIATGEALIEQHSKGKNCNMCTILQRPNFNQILKAIDLDSKLAGHYSHNQKSVISQLQTDTQEAPQAVTDTERRGIFFSEIEEELYRNDEPKEEIVQPNKKTLILKQNETNLIPENILNSMQVNGVGDKGTKLQKLNLLE